MQQESTMTADFAGLSMSTCNNCGSHSNRELYAAGRAQKHRIVLCNDCGLMYAHPLAASNLAGYLVPPDHIQPLHDDSTEVRRGRDKLPDYLAIEPVLAGLLPGHGQVIEVGAYSGLLLEHFRRAGWGSSLMGVALNTRAGGLVSMCARVRWSR